MPAQDFLLSLMFSLVITVTIANSVYLFEKLWRPEKVKLWQFIMVYYGCNALGSFIGIEISYGIVSLIFHTPLHFLHHYPDYRFSGIIVLVVGTIIYFYHAQKAGLNARLKEKELALSQLQQLKTQAELQTLQSKINPHFLYNALNSIASLIHEDADKAEDMTLKLSRLFRYSLNSQQDNMASVKDEMEIVNTYLDIEKIRFGKRINFSSHIDESLVSQRIPRFLIQPLVENALKHGLNNVVDDGLLHTGIMKEGDQIAIIVADNGKPFPQELNMGYGLQSTYDKLKILYGDNYEVHISNTPQKQVKILIPMNT